VLNSSPAYRVVSLFSGAGGMDLGFASTKQYRPVVANDILTVAAQTYSSHFGHEIADAVSFQGIKGSSGVYLLGDISDVDFAKVYLKGLEVVIGGPPCQDFSVVRGPQNERKGIEVRRGRLYAHFVRALIHLQPRVFVFENVPGLKSTNQGQAYETILEDFSKLKVREEEIKKIVSNGFEDGTQNYEILFKDIVNSSCLGVPQARRRLIILGVRSDLVDWASANNFRQVAEEALKGKNTLLSKYPLTTMEVFEGLPLADLHNAYREIMEEYDVVADQVATPRAKWWMENVRSKLTLDAEEDYLTVNKIVPKDSSELKRALKEHEATLIELGYYGKRLEGRQFDDNSNIIPKESPDVIHRLEMIPPDENHLFIKGTRWEVEGRGMSLIYRRVHPLKPSYTVVAKGGGGTWGYHYRRGRAKLTNRERARLQTFPDNFLFKGSYAEVRSQIGEAVPLLLGKRIAEVVSKILGETTKGEAWQITEKAEA
jgi:DNA (cytosine-5)-methyltransferase 1